MDAWRSLGLKESLALIYIELFLWVHKTLSNNEKTALVKLQLQVNLLLAYNTINQKQLFRKNPGFLLILFLILRSLCFKRPKFVRII